MVFIVDAVDRERFPEAKRELDVRIEVAIVAVTYCEVFSKQTLVKGA